jgi:outer membrane protein TolC
MEKDIGKMKYKIMIVIFLIFQASLVHAGGTQTMAPKALTFSPGSLTLERACEITLKNNPGMGQAKERIEGAKAVLLQAQSAWKPTITAGAGATAIQATSQPDWAQTIRTDEAFNEYSAKLQMAWLMFDGFNREANILASTHAIEQQEQARHEVQRLLVQAVSATFHQAQLALEKMTIARQNQQFNQTLEKDAKVKWRVGTAPEAEVMNFSVRALQAESDYLVAQRDFKLTGTALTKLMALPHTRLTPEMFPQSKNRTISKQPHTYEKAMEQAMNSRPDLKAINQGILALREKLRGEKGSYFPKVYFVSGMEYLYQEDKVKVDEEEHNTYAGVNVSWDLYTGARRKGKIEALAADLRALEERRRETLIAMGAEIQEAMDIADTAWATWENQEKTRELTAKVRNHVEKAYRAGVATLTRLNEAQTDLVRASGAAAASRIQYRIAICNLNAAMGMTTPHLQEEL